MLIFKMAFRNIFRQRRRSLLTGLMMTGGFTLLSLSLGLYAGVYGDIINTFTRSHTGHLQIHKEGYLKRPSLYKTINNVDELMPSIKITKHFESMVLRVYSPALAFVGVKTTAAMITGIVPDEEARCMGLNRKVGEGRYFEGPPANEVVLGPGLAEVLKAKPGSEISLIGQAADGSIANENFKVIGLISKEKSLPYDKIACYMHIETAQKFLELGGRIHEIAVLIDDQDRSREVASLIGKKLGDATLDVQPWQVVESHFYKAMKADMQGNYIMQIIIMMIVAIGVLNTVLMSILERTREFGVIRAIGTRPIAVFSLIVIETAFLSIIAIFGGTILGLLLNYWLSIDGIDLPKPIEWGGFVWDNIRSKITPVTVWMPAIVTFCTAVFVSIFPAIRAARIAPVTAMRST